MGLAKMQVIRPDVDPEDDAGDVQERVEERPEELRLLEAMLFAASEPLSEKDLAARLPQGTDVADALKRLQQDYARAESISCASAASGPSVPPAICRGC